MNEESWRNRVDERLVDLTTAQKVTNDHLDQIDETLDALDRTLRGDYEKDSDGLASRVKELEISLSKLNAVVFQDSTGKKGLVATVDALVSEKMDKVERRKSRASIIIAIITSIALVLTNLDRIGDFWIRIFGKNKPTQIERMIEHAKHPHYPRIRPPAEPALQGP